MGFSPLGGGGGLSGGGNGLWPHGCGCGFCPRDAAWGAVGGGGVPLCARLSSLGTVIPMGKKP